jgi:preprotein translocase subunit SecE
MADTKARTVVGISREERRRGGLMGAIDTVRSWPTRCKEFYRETRLEMKRVSWPERKTVQATTVVVIVTTFFFAFYLKLADFIFGALLIDGLFKRFTGR